VTKTIRVHYIGDATVCRYSAWFLICWRQLRRIGDGREIIPRISRVCPSKELVEMLLVVCRVLRHGDMVASDLEIPSSLSAERG
jgi:hypothetical protein